MPEHSQAAGGLRLRVDQHPSSPARRGGSRLAHQARFRGCSRLLQRFTDACVAWEVGKVQDAKQITETVNELLVAKALLQDPLCDHLEYEPPLTGTPKTIDFLLHSTKGMRIFYDVKTVHPDSGDGWARYERAQKKGRFPAHITVDWDATVAHYAFASREKFLEHTLELEEKIRFVPSSPLDRTYYRMVFCGDNFRWHRSDLERFADTYFGRRAVWDHFAKMERHSLKEERGLTLARTIHGFCYFERKTVDLEPVFRIDVRGPKPEVRRVDLR